MIVNFEDLTAHLTKEEIEMSNKIIALLHEKATKENPLNTFWILKEINGKPDLFNAKEKLTGVRLRKIFNAIRSRGVAPIIGTSKGYYITNDLKEIQKQITSFDNRISAMQSAKRGLIDYSRLLHG